MTYNPSGKLIRDEFRRAASKVRTMIRYKQTPSQLASRQRRDPEGHIVPYGGTGFDESIPTLDQIAERARQVREEGYTDRYGRIIEPWSEADEQKRIVDERDKQHHIDLREYAYVNTDIDGRVMVGPDQFTGMRSLE